MSKDDLILVKTIERALHNHNPRTSKERWLAEHIAEAIKEVGYRKIGGENEE